VQKIKLQPNAPDVGKRKKKREEREKEDPWHCKNGETRGSRTHSGAEMARPTTVRTGEPAVGLVKPTTSVGRDPLLGVGLDPFKNLLAPF
jgi:hypothetical protein